MAANKVWLLFQAQATKATIFVDKAVLTYLQNQQLLSTTSSDHLT